MVFQSVANHLFNRYLGAYFENSNTQKLKLDLWHGTISVENIHLKPEALVHLKLPLTVKHGHIQNFTMSISWGRLYGQQPIKITVDGLYLLAEPNTEVEYDAEKEEEKQYKAKKKEVHKIEEFRKEQREFERLKRSPKESGTLLERLQLHFIRNLELSISNIHISFEDATTKPTRPFVFGITLNYMTFQTSEEDVSVTCKLGVLNNLAMYWNCNIEPRLDSSGESVTEALHAKIARNGETSVENMTYILRPSNIKTTMKIATVPDRQNHARPVLNMTVAFEQIHLDINHDQYSDLLDLLELRDGIKLKSKYIKYYASVEAQKPSLRRWKYAYAVVVNEVVRPHRAYYKWDHIRANLHRCREYHILYLKKLNQQATKKDKQRAQELEKQIDVLNLVFTRRNAEIEMKKKTEQKETTWWNWLSRWRGGWNRNSAGLNDESTTTVNEERNVGNDNDDCKVFQYPEEYVDFHLAIQLDLLEIDVWSNHHDNDSQPTMIAQATLSNTNLMFHRRPATSAFQVIIDMDSIELYGSAMEAGQGSITEHTRLALLQCVHKLESPGQQQQLHIEFETNPANTDIDYRIRARSQPLEINYDAMTINRLIDCFYPGAHRNLIGVRRKVYTIYTDIRHRLQFLLNYNLRNIDNLDIDIDCQSVYFRLPENGADRNECASVCLDLGHFIVQGGRNQVHQIDEEVFQDAQSTTDDDNPSYVPVKARLVDMQLLYIESNARHASIHLIKPFTIGVDLFKCIHVDDAVLPLWKMEAQVSVVTSRLTNTRLLSVINLIRSVPSPQSTKSSTENETIKQSFISEAIVPEKNTKKLFETIENMTLMKKHWQDAYNTGDKDSTRTKLNAKAQLIEVEATLDIPYVDFRIDESGDTRPFARIILMSVGARTLIKKFSMDLDAYLTDLIILHEQFLTNNNEPLRLFSTEAHGGKLISLKCLFTSPENPSFYSAPYDRIEDKIRIRVGKPVVLLQVEALASILRFRNHLMERIAKRASVRKADSSKDDGKQSLAGKSTRQIETDLDQVRVIVGTEFSQLLDVQLQGLMISLRQSSKRTIINLNLDNIYAVDLHAHTRYRNLIVRQDPYGQVLQGKLISYNYSATHKKKIDEVDYSIKIHWNKMTLTLLYKYVHLMLNILNAFQREKTKASPVKMNTTYDKIRFDIIVNTPTIFVPIDAHADEGISIDFGQWILKTPVFNDFERSHREQQVLIINNFLISRIRLSDTNDTLESSALLECAELYATMERLLYPNENTNQAETSVQISWETIDMTLSKADYACLTEIFRDNFSEQVSYTTLLPMRQEQSDVEEKIDKQIDQSDAKVSEKVQLDCRISRISLMLFLDEADRPTSQNKTTKFLDMAIEMIELHFRQLSDSSYTAQGQIQCVLLDDLRETDPPMTVTRMLSRNLRMDQHLPMFIVTVHFQPNKLNLAAGVRQVDIQLESFYLWLSCGCCALLKSFFTSTRSTVINATELPSPNQECIPLPAKYSLSRKSSDQSLLRTSSDQVSPSLTSSIDTEVNALIKTSHLCWLEHQYSTDSNCLALDFSLQMRMDIVSGETHVTSSIRDMAIYIFNFAQFKDVKTTYYILQPMTVELGLRMTSTHEIFDVHIEDILVHIAPTAIRTIARMVDSMNKCRVVEPETKENITSKSLFDPKPFTDASFWFLESLRTLSGRSWSNSSFWVPI